ncbi:MAG: carboxypeptidase regulatory-like domain-containing protein [Pyrinomonadaceae bacterium]
MKKLNFHILIGMLFTLFIFSFTTFGQSINGTISGSVSDQQSAAVVGAKVTVTNSNTGFERTAIANANGNFRIAGIPVGSYTVRVEANGFAANTSENVQVSTGTETDLKFELSTSGVEVSVEVTSAGEVLDTTQSQVTKTIGERQILELPGRNSLNGLALLNPGVLPNNNGRPGSGFAVNGNRTRSNNFTIDGANNNDQSLSIPRQNLPPEAIKEFQAITNSFQAEYGRNAGSYINQLIR